MSRPWTRGLAVRARIGLLALLFAVRVAEGAAPRRVLPDYERVVLKNGLTVLVMEHHELPLVSFEMIIKAGSSVDPPGKEGLAGMTASLLHLGSASKTAVEFAEEVDFLGGTLDAGGDSDRTSISGEFLARDFDRGLKLLAEMVLDPAFRAEELERARSEAQAAVIQDRDDPAAIASKHFLRALYGDHPYGRPTDGTEQSIPRLTREEVLALHTARYAPNNAILAVVGDVTREKALAAVRSVFGGWAKRRVPPAVVAEPPPVRGKRVVIVDKPDLTQSEIRLGTVGIRRADKAYFPAQVAGTILGGGFTSWLNQEIREKRGLSYGASCGFDARLAAGPFVVRTLTKNATVGETVQVALDTLARFRAGGVGAPDLGRAQAYRAGRFPLTVETTDQLAQQLAGLEFYGLTREFFDRQIETLRTVTLADLKGISARLPGEDYVLVVVSNAAAVKPQLEKFGQVSVVRFDAM
jgi:zinc protease